MAALHVACFPRRCPCGQPSTPDPTRHSPASDRASYRPAPAWAPMNDFEANLRPGPQNTRGLLECERLAAFCGGTLGVSAATPRPWPLGQTDPGHHPKSLPEHHRPPNLILPRKHAPETPGSGPPCIKPLCACRSASRRPPTRSSLAPSRRGWVKSLSGRPIF